MITHSRYPGVKFNKKVDFTNSFKENLIEKIFLKTVP